MNQNQLLKLFKDYVLFLIKQEITSLEKQISLTKEAEKFIQDIDVNA